MSGERRGPLVGRDHQIGVVPVVAHHPRGRDHRRCGQVVGHVEQAADENPVARDPLLLDRLAPGVHGKLLGHEAALRADRHDYRVLDLLGLREPQHLGAEVLAPVRPADAAAGDGAAAQVHALHPRRIDEDLVLRPRLGQLRNPVRVELERDVRLQRPALAALEAVRAQRRADDADVAAQDAVLVEVGHLVERRLDPGHDLQLRVELLDGRVLRGLRVLRRRRLARPVGVEADEEQLHQHRGDRGDSRPAPPACTSSLNVTPAWRRYLQYARRIDDLAPSEPRPQHQPVEAVVLDLPPTRCGRTRRGTSRRCGPVRSRGLPRGASRNRGSTPARRPRA